MEKIINHIKKYNIQSILLLISAYYIMMNVWTLFISMNLVVSPYLKVIVILIPFVMLGYVFIRKDYIDSKIKIPTVLLAIFVVYFVLLHQVISSNNSPTQFGPFTLSYFVIEMIYLVPAVVYLFTYESSNKVRHVLNKIFKLTLIVMISNFIISIVLMLFIDLNLSRSLATGFYKNPLIPVSTFDIVYASVLSTILLFHLVMKKKWKDKRLNSLFLLSCLFILVAGFLISIVLLSLGIFILVFVNLSQQKKKIIVGVVLAILALTLFTNVIDGFFFLLAKSISNKTVASKFLDIANFLKTGEVGYSISERLRVYRDPIDATIKSYGLGIFYFDAGAKISNHSTVLYTLATTGVIGLTVFIYSMYKYFDFYFRKIKSKDGKLVWIVIGVIFLLMMTLNPVFSRPTIFIVLFLYIPYYLLKEEEVTNENNVVY